MIYFNQVEIQRYSAAEGSGKNEGVKDEKNSNEL